MTATTSEPTLLEQVQALEVTVRRLAAERDAAMQMGAQATKDLVRARHQIAAQDLVNKSRLAVIGGLNVENRRLSSRNHELAIANEDLRTRSNRPEQETPPARRSWWSRRIRSQL